LETWAQHWLAALQSRFTHQWKEHALHTGDGIRALLGSPEDLQQAAEIANCSLLASQPVNAETLRRTCEQLLAFVTLSAEPALHKRPFSQAGSMERSTVGQPSEVSTDHADIVKSRAVAS
jgi:hypothetical protein